MDERIAKMVDRYREDARKSFPEADDVTVRASEVISMSGVRLYVIHVAIHFNNGDMDTD